MAVPFENQTNKNLHNNYSSFYTDMEIKDGWRQWLTQNLSATTDTFI